MSTLDADFLEKYFSQNRARFFRRQATRILNFLSSAAKYAGLEPIVEEFILTSRRMIEEEKQMEMRVLAQKQSRNPFRVWRNHYEQRKWRRKCIAAVRFVELNSAHKARELRTEYQYRELKKEYLSRDILKRETRENTTSDAAYARASIIIEEIAFPTAFNPSDISRPTVEDSDRPSAASHPGATARSRLQIAHEAWSSRNLSSLHRLLKKLLRFDIQEKFATARNGKV